MTMMLSVLHEPVAEHIAEAVRLLDDELTADQPFVLDLCERLRGYRGKMLRPTLLLLSARACGDVRHEHIVLAAVVEMVHLATLVHDDVLDDADIRRGGPTIHRLHGNETAVLLGDYLISHAYHLCSRLDSPQAARRIAATTNTVCEGELMQVAHRGNWSLTEEEYLDIIRRKTAALTAVCCELGAAFAGAEPPRVRRLSGYGADLGVAFQIVDDLLDLTATEQEMGKSLRRDADLGKLTMPLIHYLSHADEASRRRLIDALAAGHFDPSGSNGDPAGFSESVEYAMTVARAHISSAVEQVSDLPPGDARDALTAAAEFVLQRRQ
jgi:octaprenyl-diphosphate synthase